MVSIGLDIGTTTICGVAVDSKTGTVLDSITLNNSFIEGTHEWEKIQDPQMIVEKAFCILNEMNKKYTVACLGITGQMHGIVYLDKRGNPLSPLYTWQDLRSSLEYKNGKSYAEYIGEKSGYGSATHFYNTANNLVDKNAVSFCTIHDFIAMKLTGNTYPYTDVTDGASLGLFDLEKKVFDEKSINKLGLDYTMFPKIMGSTQVIGKTETGIPVITPLGDNQTSFIGSVRDMNNTILVNAGTGSQISLYSKTFKKSGVSETRPCMNNGFLLVGASLCGGRAYSMLEKFFNDIVEMSTGKRIANMYDKMDKAIEDEFNSINPPEIITTFCGTRDNPYIKGSILNIDADNFNPKSFSLGMLNGIVTELYDLYSEMRKEVENRFVLIGSGNGIRKNKLLQKIFAARFQMQLLVPAHKEEAAYGAAINAFVGIEKFKTIQEAQKLIKYEGEE